MKYITPNLPEICKGYYSISRGEVYLISSPQGDLFTAIDQFFTATGGPVRSCGYQCLGTLDRIQVHILLCMF